MTFRHVTSAPFLNSDSLPSLIPLLELEGILLLPRAHLPLQIQESKHMRTIDTALGQQRFVGLIQPSDDKSFHTGCLGQISSFVDRGDGSYIVILKGIIRFHIEENVLNHNHQSAKVTYEPYLLDLSHNHDSIEREYLITLLKGLLKQNDTATPWEDILEASNESLISLLAMMCPFDPLEKQAILESHTLKDRLYMITSLMEMASKKLTPWSVH